MNPTPSKFVGKSPQHSRVRLGSMFILMLCVFLLTAVPALADAIQINQVVQTLTSPQGRPDLRLNTLVSQDPAKGSAPQTQAGPGKESQAANQGGTKPESIISGVSVTGEGQ